MAYKPIQISGYSQGLIQSKENFLLPDDAYPTLRNAYCWRDKLKTKRGLEFLGRLRRSFSGTSLGASTAGTWNFNLFSTVSPAITETNKELDIGTLSITIGAVTLTDDGDGTLSSVTPGNSGTVNYFTGAVSLTHTGGSVAATVDFSYFPTLPVMGLRSRETSDTNLSETIAFDTTYAYDWNGSNWTEFIPGTTWNGTENDGFWTENYYFGDNQQRIMWVTNGYFDSGTGNDPIRVTNGTAWGDFKPQINATDFLWQAKMLLAFRGRLVAFNTYEGATAGTTTQKANRIRWSWAGTPFDQNIAGIVTSSEANAWRDDVPGGLFGGFIDIPTNESIISVGVVRDNLVIYCNTSTWQLRYNTSPITPFILEKVNTELGGRSRFGSVQFDTSLMTIGDKGIVNCDSFKSERIDQKIPDLVYSFSIINNATDKVQSVRDFEERMAYWTFPTQAEGQEDVVYPNKRLVFNYDNQSWAIFDDSLTALGYFYEIDDITWEEANEEWQNVDRQWAFKLSYNPSIVGGNQQGYTFYLDELTTNQESLSIQGITGNVTTPTSINVPNHNLQTGNYVKITNIVDSTPFDDLNGTVFSVKRVDADNLLLYKFDSTTGQFDTEQLNPNDTYVGGGELRVIDIYDITSKKFSFMDIGENTYFGYVDILVDSTADGEFTLNLYTNYDNDVPVNSSIVNADPFFNSTVPTTQTGTQVSSKVWQRVFCSAWGNFITLQYTLSPSQINSDAYTQYLQINAQTLWLRPGGKNLIQGF